MRKRKSPLVCPECGGSLNAERVEGIEIDRCIHCVGVWLDAGEYDAVRRHIEHPYSATFAHEMSETSPDSKAGEVLGFGVEFLLVLGELFF